ncbi:MAG: hypothetical protein DMF74_20265 [Acidobacteria bacterium]|nr:MAG: hypothetical protein DMF74_20265 [Acidobacteriota bacterium]
MPPPPPVPPPPPEPPPAGAPSTFWSIAMILSSWVTVHVTLSAPCMRCDRPWLLDLSRLQVPAKLAFWALAATTKSMNAAINPAIKNNLFIRNSSVNFLFR